MIFDNPFFTEMLLPFLLVFVVTFAILQKSKILGEGKAQIDAIVGLVIGLILIGVPGPRDILVGLMPWMSVGIGVILVFLILYGFVAGDLSNLGDSMSVKIGVAVLTGVFTLVVVLFVTGWGSGLWKWFRGSSDIWMNVFMVMVVLAVVGVAMKGGKKKK